MNIQVALSKIIIKCSEVGLDIKHIDIRKINLETIFLSLTGKQLRDKMIKLVKKDLNYFPVTSVICC